MQTSTEGSQQHALNRRAFLRLAALGGGLPLLAACGAAPPTPGSSSATAPTDVAAPAASTPAPSGGTTTAISFWTPGGSPAFCDGFNTIAKNFKQVNPAIAVGETQCGVGKDQDFNQVLLAQVAAGSPPDSTILWTSPTALGARGALEPIDDLMANSTFAGAANWPAAVLASCQFGGKTYGLPVTAGTYGAYFNQELFEEVGLPSKREEFPKTWDELRRFSKEITRWNGDTLERAGFLVSASPSSAAVELTIWMALNGGTIYDADKQAYTIDSDPNRETMEYLLSWLNEEYKGDFTKVTTSGNWQAGPDDSGRPAAFPQGRQGIFINGFWYAGDMYETEPTFKRWEVASLPVGPSGTKSISGYWPNWLAIPKGTKNREAAFQYLDYLSGEGVKTWFATIPDLPANRKVPDTLVPKLVGEKRGVEFAQNITTFFRSQLDIVIPMWNSPVQDFANDQLGRAFEQVLTKAAAPKAALAEAQTACQAELTKLLKGAS